MLPIDISEPDAPPFQVSKSRKIAVLISPHEMEALFQSLEPFTLYNGSRPVNEAEFIISKEDFLKNYRAYVEGIQKSELVDEAPLTPFFSAILSRSPKALHGIALSNGKYLIKAREPIIQLQRHHFIVTDTFHSGVISQESITWGLLFSYPQLYLDPETSQIGKVVQNKAFENTELFKQLTKWLRDHSKVTPLLHQGARVNQPFRLGSECFAFINNHPKLKEKNIHVD